jgi:NhaP-type Na+/H+ or K+/H+ antiporter
MKKLLPYGGAFLALAATAGLSGLTPALFHIFEKNSEHELLGIFFQIGLLFVLSFIIFYISHITALPSFVIAIFFGIAAQKALIPIVTRHELLGAVVGISATLILFSGGLETPFANFKKLLGRIISLSFVGLFLTAIAFSLTVLAIGHGVGTSVPLIIAVLLGAVLSSTDPAAIIPVLKKLRFHNRSTKDLIISESAVTDVTGTLLTIAFLTLIAAGVTLPSIQAWYGAIFSAHSGLIVLKQIVFGSAFGVVGYAFLELLQRLKRRHEREFEADSAFFLFVPVTIFAIAVSFGGSGYLAAFIAGLIFNLTEHLHQTERFFNHVIDGFLKPMIFILLGALVNLEQLIAYAGVGVLAALVFMILIRPLAVYTSLGPWALFGRERFSFKDLLFISCVRETGAIPAVLLITIAGLGLPDAQALVAIGMWVILLTLIIEPIMTPAVARLLKVAEPIADDHKAEVGASPVVLLGTRGRSFINRLPRVAEWAMKHSIKRVVVLLCLENKFTPGLEQEIIAEAEQKFAHLNTTLPRKLEFSVLSRRGFLQTNIKALAEKDTSVTAIFVGHKMLDFRLKEIKKLHTPLYFME